MDNLTTFLLVAPVVLFSVVAHEYAHGLAAYTQGDKDVDLSFHPRPYIDPVGTILVPIITYMMGAPFGWARSAPFDPRKFKHLKRSDIIVSLAGVTANFLVALLATGLILLLGVLGAAAPATRVSVAILQTMLQFAVLFNLLLVALNLIPIPPLDGSRVLYYLLPPSWALRYRRLGLIGFFVVFMLLGYGPVQRAVFGPSQKLYVALMQSVSSRLMTDAWTR